MYLEGLGVPRDYARAMYYFSNASNPLFNSSNHVFGRGILHFYGLGVPRNESLGCRLFEEASRLTAGKGVFSYSTNRGFFLKVLFGSLRAETPGVSSGARPLHRGDLPGQVRAVDRRSGWKRGNRELVSPNGRAAAGRQKNRGSGESLRADHSEQDPRLFPPADGGSAPRGDPA